MRPHLVIGSAPVFNDHFGLHPGAEPLHGEAFVPEFAVDALDHAVLPGLAGIDQGNFEPLIRHPAQERLGDKLRTVVRTQLMRRPAFADQARQDFDHPIRPDASGNVNGKALSGVAPANPPRRATACARSVFFRARS